MRSTNAVYVVFGNEKDGKYIYKKKFHYAHRSLLAYTRVARWERMVDYKVELEKESQMARRLVSTK